VKEIHVEFKTEDRFFTNRKKEILAIIMFPDKKVLISTKEFYEKGLYRLTTGGMEPGETPEDALKREVYEETGIIEFESEKVAVVKYACKTGFGDFSFETYIFLVNVEDQEIKTMDPDEKITDFKRVDIEELIEFSNRLSKVKNTNYSIDGKPVNVSDWGRFRKIATDISVEYLRSIV